MPATQPQVERREALTVPACQLHKGDLILPCPENVGLAAFDARSTVVLDALTRRPGEERDDWRTTIRLAGAHGVGEAKVHFNRQIKVVRRLDVAPPPPPKRPVKLHRRPAKAPSVARSTMADLGVSRRGELIGRRNALLARLRDLECRFDREPCKDWALCLQAARLELNAVEAEIISADW